MADTIKTGTTTLIKERALISESLRFESEPWTSFYMAGEMIRELRKPPENKATAGAKATSGDCPKAPERLEDDRRRQWLRNNGSLPDVATILNL